MSELVRDLAKQIAEALADDRYRQAQDELQALAGELADWWTTINLFRAHVS